MNSPAHRWIGRLGVLLGLALAGLAGALVPAAPASAHAVLVSTSPLPEVVLDTHPSEVVLTFSESVRQIPDKIRVIGPDGSRVDTGNEQFNGAVVTIPLDNGGPMGTYLVSYRVVSADSHPVSGGYTYSVGERTTPPEDTADAPANRVVSTGVQASRLLSYVGLALLVGPTMVLGLLWPRRLSRRVPGRLIWTGLGLLAAATVVGLWLQVPYTAGGGPFAVTAAGLVDVLGTPFGAAYLVRLGILAAAVLILRPYVAGTAGRFDGWILLGLGVAGAFTWPLAGHAAASPIPPVSVLADAVHLGAMAVWLGGLVMLVAVLLRHGEERELEAILPVWSRWATVAVSALLLAGIVQALIEVVTLDALVSTTYGRLVIAKAVLFGLVVAVAAFARGMVRRRVAPGRPGRMRAAVWTEVVVVTVVLALAAVLVQTTPARTQVAINETSDFFTTRVTSPVYEMEAVVDPAETGNVSIHLYAYDTAGKPLPVVEWRVSVALPAQGVEPIDVPVLPLADNHVTGEINLPTAGEWRLRVTARTSEIDQATVTITVPIT